MRIITPVREPVSRRVSGFSQSFERHLGADHRQTTVAVAVLTEIFLINRYLWQPPCRFDVELKDKLAVDVYDYPLPQSEGWLVIKGTDLRTLSIRLEIDDAINLEAISGFLDQSSFRLTRLYVGLEKAYPETYRAFIQAIRLPEACVEGLCNANRTRHFYSDVEIEGIQSKWLGRN